MAMGSVVGGELGSMFSKKDRGKARNYLEDNRTRILGIENPALADLWFDPEMYDDALLETAVQQGDTELGNISLDPATREAQMQALARMQEIGENGTTAIDRANTQRMLTDIDARNRGAREAVSQNMKARGIQGSGLEMTAQMMANQAAAQEASQRGMDLNAQAQMRALQAMQNAGTLGGQIRGQDYGIESDRARAQDMINQYNSQNRQGVMGRNIDRQNQTRVANTDMRNNAGLRNKDLYQQRFENDLAKNQAVQGANQALSDYHGQKAGMTQQKYAGYGRAQDEAFYNGADMFASMYGGGVGNKAKGGGAA